MRLAGSHGGPRDDTAVTVLPEPGRGKGFRGHHGRPSLAGECTVGVQPLGSPGEAQSLARIWTGPRPGRSALRGRPGCRRERTGPRPARSVVRDRPPSRGSLLNESGHASELRAAAPARLGVAILIRRDGGGQGRRHHGQSAEHRYRRQFDNAGDPVQTPPAASSGLAAGSRSRRQAGRRPGRRGGADILAVSGRGLGVRRW